MTQPDTPDTDQLLASLARGDDAVRGPLLERHRDRLRRLIALRLDPRIAGRVDPSDVLQESFAEAHGRLSDYLRRRPLPFYLWLRQIVWERLVDAHRSHVRAQGRSVCREEPAGLPLPDSSADHLAGRLAGGVTPGTLLERDEARARVRVALAALGPADREVLVLRYLEGLSLRDTALALGLSESAVKMRQLRALQRLRDLLSEEGEP